MSKLSPKNLLILLPILAILIISSTFFYFVQNNSNSSQNLNLKPISSVIFSYNSELKPLVADADHDVVVLEECDLAVRYNKKYKTSYKENSDIFTIHDVETVASYTIKKCDKNRPKEFIEREKYDNNKDANDIQLPIPFYGRPETNSWLGNENISGFNVEDFKGWTMGGSPAYILYEIKSKNGFYYEVNPSSQFEAKEDFQFQINSLAPSTPSVKL